jgi:structural maintenance of chromosomes protein 5
MIPSIAKRHSRSDREHTSTSAPSMTQKSRHVCKSKCNTTCIPHSVPQRCLLCRLRNLDDENVRKLQDLAKWDKDCHDAVLWLRKPENQEKFRMPVIEPPCVTLTVPDKKYTNAVEACFNANQLKVLQHFLALISAWSWNFAQTFVTQCQEDYRTLNRCINDEDGLGRKVRINTWYRAKDERSIAGPPLSSAEVTSITIIAAPGQLCLQMAALNFDDYALNQVACPDGLLWYLKKEIQLHRTVRQQFK